MTVQANDLPYGALLLPSNADPTNGGQPLATNYLRPYRGYGGIGVRDWTGYNDYHSIQVSVNRRMSKGLAFGVAYTGAKRKSIGTFDPFLSEAANEPGHSLHSTVFWVESDADPVASAEIAEVRWTPLHDHPDDLAPMLEHHVLPVIRATAGEA